MNMFDDQLDYFKYRGFILATDNKIVELVKTFFSNVLF